MKLKIVYILSLLPLLLLVACSQKKSGNLKAIAPNKSTVKSHRQSLGGPVQIDSTTTLVIFKPKFTKVELYCGQMPSKANRQVVLCAEAAFTGKCLDKFDHLNIAGDHVSAGRRYPGYSCKVNTGAFVYANGGWQFLYKDYSGALDYAAENHGMGFAQILIVHQGVSLDTGLKALDKPNIYRALCEIDHQLCIIETRTPMTISDFQRELLLLDVDEALYLDMGKGWNHSWYRDADGNARDIHPYSHPYCTNWIAFIWQDV